MEATTHPPPRPAAVDESVLIILLTKIYTHWTPWFEQGDHCFTILVEVGTTADTSSCCAPNAELNAFYHLVWLVRTVLPRHLLG